MRKPITTAILAALVGAGGMLASSDQIAVAAQGPASGKSSAGKTANAGTSRVLLEGVQAFQVKMEPMKSAAAIKSGGAFDLLKRATILITIKTSGQSADVDESALSQSVTLSSSVMPRRNSW
jgi:hypothetical protein